jgi:hypothetical protein
MERGVIHESNITVLKVDNSIDDVYTRTQVIFYNSELAKIYNALMYVYSAFAIGTLNRLKLRVINFVFHKMAVLKHGNYRMAM